MLVPPTLGVHWPDALDWPECLLDGSVQERRRSVPADDASEAEQQEADIGALLPKLVGARVS